MVRGLAPVSRVTRDVEPSTVRDLLDQPRRATVAFVDRGGIELLPVQARGSDGAHRFGIAADPLLDLDGREVVLLMDDGAFWFELRGMSVRGVARRGQSPESRTTERLAWYTIEPRRVLAWDYGTLRRT